MQAILDQSHAAEDRGTRKNNPGQTHQRLPVTEPERGSMIRRCPVVFAQADNEHLRQSAANWLGKGGVRLDSVDDDDPVRPRSLATPQNLPAVLRLAKRLDLHRGADRHAHRRLRHAVTSQHRHLSLRRRAAVTAHRRDDERLRPGLLQLTNDGGDGLGQVGNPPTADANANPHARLQLPANRLESVGHRGGDVYRLRGVEPLPHTEHLGKFIGHRLEPSKGIAWPSASFFLPPPLGQARLRATV